ncbi:MAG: NADAR family protein [Gammaproteobacteria bacterium]
MFEPEDLSDAVLIVRGDPHELLGTHSPHGFALDDDEWLSAEHYYQAMKFLRGAHYERIRDARHPDIATRLGHAWFKRHRPRWRRNRITYMTRALYTKCHAHPAVRERLLETADKRIIECSSFDAFWGCGRDGRGDNHYGKLLERVRDKLREETFDGA